MAIIDERRLLENSSIMVFHKDLIQITYDVFLRGNMKGGWSMKLKSMVLSLAVAALMISVVQPVLACEYTP